MTDRPRSYSSFAALLVLVAFSTACDVDTFEPDTGPSDFVAVTTGGNHSCGLTSEGVAWCWGGGSYGQLGTGDSASSSRPRRVATDLRFTDISAGQGHTCALVGDGSAWCWGWNAFSQRGNAFDDPFALPVQVQNAVGFVEIDAGDYHTCAIDDANQLFCWGYNQHGQLGRGHTSVEIQAELASFDPIWEDVSAGAAHTCALDTTGNAHCWGLNATGQLGVGDADSSRLTPRAVAGGHTFREISAGATHSCGVTVGREAMCWGSNVHGELGDGAPYQPGLPAVTEPRAVVWNRNARQVEAGTYVTCAIDLDDEGHCWGRGLYGQLGGGGTDDQALPQPVFLQPTRQMRGDLLKLEAVSVGGDTHGCSLSEERAIYCWGTSDPGALGNRYSLYSPVPLQVELPRD